MNDHDKLNEIIAGCQRGSNEAFSELVDIYKTRCYGYFYRLTGDTAKSNDLLSELFLRLVEKIRSFRGSSFENWLFTIASNIFHDYLRQKYRQKKLLDGKTKQMSLERMPSNMENEMYDRLQEKMAKLDNETAELLTLRYYGQLSFKELAVIRSEPIGTTLSKVHRGLKKLKELMEDTNE